MSATVRGLQSRKKTGKIRLSGRELEIIDLPGIYSLFAETPDELVTIEFLESYEADIIINVIDASRLQRSLYLTLRLLETNIPLVVLINMPEMALKKNIFIDTEMLSQLLGVPVLELPSCTPDEAKRVLTLICSQTGKLTNNFCFRYNRKTEEALSCFINIFEKHRLIKNPRFAAIRYFEESERTAYGRMISSKEKQMLDRINDGIFSDRELVLSRLRYDYTDKISKSCIAKSPDGSKTLTERIDDILLNKILALPIFLGVIFMVFFAAFGPFGSYLRESMDFFIKRVITPSFEYLLVRINSPEWLRELVIKGIMGGVGSLLAFLPQLIILFLTLCLLEDSGYMTRAACIMDRIFRYFGLSGRSFIPLILGFGCTLPAVMSARIIKNPPERRLTLLIIPFASCSAKLPVYALFCGMFFPNHQLPVIFLIYILGLLLGFLSVLVIRKMFKNKASGGFILELPDYHLPRLKNIWRQLSEKIYNFLKKLGSVLLAASVVIWFLQSFSVNLSITRNSEESILAALGRLISPVFKPLGFGNWIASTAVLTGIAGKEIIAGTLGILYLGEPERLFTPLSALSFMIFVLLYTPCIAATAAFCKETGSKKWAAAAIFYQIAIAWLAAFVVYNLGKILTGLQING